MQPVFQPVSTSRMLGWTLQSTRKSKRLTQAHLASRVGISQSRISHLEQHPEELSAQQLLAWCSALELELGIRPKAALDPKSTSSDTTPAW